jgi:hypothetical protein
MPLKLDSLQGSVYVDEQPAQAGQSVAYENCVAVGDNSSVCIFDGPDLAATLAKGGIAPAEDVMKLLRAAGGGSARLATYAPPVTAVNPIYYRRSYRTQIRTPGGSVGIRV